MALALIAVMVACHSADGQDSGASSKKARLRAIQWEAVRLEVDARFLARQLFESYRDLQVDSSEVAQTALKTAMAAVRDPCGTSYRAVLIRRPGVPLERPDSMLAYVIGEAPGDQYVMLGRHYRVELSPDGKTVRSIIPSTRDCTDLLLSDLTDARYITHSLSLGATEFHAFLSLLHQTKFRVRTPMGLWVVENGDIELVTIDPAYRPKQYIIKDCQLLDGTKFATTEEACRHAGGTILE